MPTILAITYDSSTGTYRAGKIGTAQIADLAITSALINIDAIGKEHIRDLNIVSAAIGANEIGKEHIRDLNVTSAKLTAALIASIEAGVADGGITSAKIASGAVGSVHLMDSAVKSGDIAANAIGGGHILDGSLTYAELANATLVSAKYGANEIGTPHILAGGILSAAIGVDEIGKEHIRDGEIVSAAIGAGEIGDALLMDYGVVSGKVASGAITENELASGLSIDISEMVQEPSYRAEDLISAYLGVQFSISGYFDFAQARVATTMPAIGITTANILSGQVGTFRYQGRMTNPNWDFSGYVGKLLFLGLSSEVTLTAPTASGDCVQRIGKVVDADTIFVRPELFYAQIAE